MDSLNKTSTGVVVQVIGAVVDVDALIEKGIVKNPRDGVKILGNGQLTKKLTVQANAFSASAVAKIEAKQVVVDEIKSKLEKAEGVVLVSSRGLTVGQDTEMRKALRGAGVDFKVYKNTMMNFAFKGTDFEALAPYLEGPSAMAYSDTDATAPARVLAEFAKKADKLQIKAGVVEGTVYDATGMAKIADIPSREVLLGRLLGSMQSPIANLARVLNQIAEKDGAPAAEAPAEA